MLVCPRRLSQLSRNDEEAEASKRRTPNSKSEDHRSGQKKNWTFSSPVRCGIWDVFLFLHDVWFIHISC